jgi:hypothetical protein
LRKSGDGRARQDAAAVHADVDLDERGKTHARVLGCRLEGRDADLGVDAECRRADAAEGGKTGKLPRAGHLVAYENVSNSTPGQDLRFRHLLHALTDGAAGHLEVGDDRRFMGLRMRSKLDAGLARERRHKVKIPLEGVEVDEKGGRVNLVDWRARLGGRRLKHEPLKPP